MNKLVKHKSSNAAIVMLVLVLVLVWWITPLTTQEVTLPHDALVRVQKYFESALIKARYMEQKCDSTSYPKWENFPLTKCTYAVKDKNGATKSAVVIMLNPSPEKLARWIVYACLAVKGRADKSLTDALSKHILNQSGAQFPIAGIVWEDILPADGIYEIYCFRDGVTVGVKGVKHRSTEQPNAEEIENSLYGDVEWSGNFARLQGTTREQYQANGGQVDVGNSAKGNRKLIWLDVNREMYQAAWNQDRNEMMIAWAKENL